MQLPENKSPLGHELPDLIIELSRDGRILSCMGGRGLPEALREPVTVNATLDAIWPRGLADLLRRLVRKAIATRTAGEARSHEYRQTLQIRVTPQGPERALCVLRPDLPENRADDAGDTGRGSGSFLDRRGFYSRLEETLSWYALTERAAAVIVIELDGIEQVARLDEKSAEVAIGVAVARASDALAPSTRTPAHLDYLGQLRDDQIGLVLETSNRADIERTLGEITTRLSQSISVGDRVFNLTPYMGVAILGRDASDAKGLLDQARIAASEAHRGMEKRVRFFSDTMRMKSLARLDLTRELGTAIAGGAIGMRYAERHELDSGKLVALVGYATWSHPLRGQIPAKEFIGVAEATGAAILLSRAMLRSVLKDFESMQRTIVPGVRVSFGPLRHHLLHEDFFRDIASVIEEGGLPAAQLEIRLSEQSLTALTDDVCARLHGLGIQLVVDEAGRSFGSLDRLARTPLWGLQLDRSRVQALLNDPVAQRVCRAQVAAAQALGLVPIASGVDHESLRPLLQNMGCSLGMGDIYNRIGSTGSQSVYAA